LFRIVNVRLFEPPPTSAAAIVTVRPFPIIVPRLLDHEARGAARWNAALIVCGAATFVRKTLDTTPRDAPSTRTSNSSRTLVAA